MPARYREYLITVVFIILFYFAYKESRHKLQMVPLDQILENTCDVCDVDDIVSTLNRNKVKADNDTLVKVIRSLLEPPSKLPYNLLKPMVKDPSVGQTSCINKWLNEKTNGFFIECGAYDGENYSNSLYFERYRNWTGLLIEANPNTFKTLKGKHRKSHLLKAGLSGKAYPKTETFLVNVKPTQARRVGHGQNGKQGYIEVQCFPLYSVLLAMNQLYVDYFSLDVEGAERDVLDSLPWDKIHIQTISIEYHSWLGRKKPMAEKRSDLINYMKDKGYSPIKQMYDPKGMDVIFVKGNGNEQLCE